MPLDDRDGTLDLIDHVEGVGVARVGEDDVDEGAGEVVAVVGGAREGVAVVDVGVGDVLDVTAEDDEASDADAVAVPGCKSGVQRGMCYGGCEAWGTYKMRVMTFKAPKMLVAQREYLLCTITPGLC